MGRDYFLDKDIIIGKDFNVYMVYGNINSYGYVYAYLKYVYTGKGLWKGYERAFKFYGIHNLMKISQSFLYEPCYDVSFPIILRSVIHMHLKPECKLKQIISRTNNRLEEIAVEIYENIGIENMGITGSLLAGISHGKSDIDFVIYGAKNSMDFMNSFKGFEKDDEWIYETQKNYKISIEVAKELYDVRVRGVYKGIKYSFLFVNPFPQKYCDKVCKRVGEGEIIADISDNSNSLFYPSVVSLSNVSIVKGEYFPKVLVSYEGIYSTLLYKAKRIFARGMIMKCNDGEIRILIGDRDVNGYVKKIL